MSKSWLRKIFDFAPVTISFTLASIFVYFLSVITFGWTNRMFFSLFRSSPLNPLTYFRLFSYSIGHSSFSHLAANLGIFILVLGVLMERHYGSKLLLIMKAVTSVVLGVIHLIFHPNYRAIGASGIVFMLIFLSAYTYLGKLRWGRWPIGIIVIAIFYFGREFIGLGGQLIGINTSNTAYAGHILGGICGMALGAIVQKAQENQATKEVTELKTEVKEIKEEAII